MALPTKKPTKTQVALYLTRTQRATLDRLHAVTRVPRTVLMEEAVDDLFVKYAHLLKQRGKS